jgi:tetraacyldisaccharide 4'-kinase
MRAAARVLAGIFGGAVRLRNSLYDAGTLPARRLQGPVVSVGNLSVGGAGKTPFVILLGEMLRARGIRFDVLSRGYRRQSKGVVLVDPHGAAADFGDEPLLIARRLGVAVVVGEVRYDAGAFAEKQFGAQLHLLDDGFQHRQLARDFDIVLVTPEDARDRMLPAGRLREPLLALGRADAVVLASGADPAKFPLDGKQVWRVRRGIVAENIPPQPIAFCAIARPQNFFAQLRKAGVEPAAEACFPDHYAYTEKDVRDLLFLREQSEGGGFVATEKDAVNLGPLANALHPLAIVPVKMELADAARAMDVMLDTLSRRGKRVT